MKKYEALVAYVLGLLTVLVLSVLVLVSFYQVQVLTTEVSGLKKVNEVLLQDNLEIKDQIRKAQLQPVPITVKVDYPEIKKSESHNLETGVYRWADKDLGITCYVNLSGGLFCFTEEVMLRNLQQRK